MKTLQELEEIRKKTLDSINIRTDRTGTRIVIGMATCGIAAGARPVMLSIMAEVEANKLKDTSVAQTGCIGMCKYEPIVEVYKPGEDKVTYINVTEAKAKRILQEHVINGKVVQEYTITN